MIDLFHEVLSRFPEIKDHLSEGDEELPYVYFSYIASWIDSLPRTEITNKIILRISSFGDWCCEQPEGNDASDHLPTILMVGLDEHLAESDSGRKVLSKIWSKEYVRESETYLRQWLAEGAYDKLLAEYGAT